MPLSWDSGKASDIAARWQTLTMDAIRRLGRAAIRVYVDAGAHFTVPPEGAPFVTATFTQGAAGHPVQTFGALVSTVGFGVERTTAKPNFRGFQFWEEDTLQSNGQCGTNLADPRILISGAGDGALQDLLRVMTGRLTAAEVFNRCLIPADIAADLKDIDRQASACIMWGSKPEHDHPVHRALDEECVRLAEKAYKKLGVAQSVTQMVGRQQDIRVLLGCDHLTAFYGLNRFLAHLLAVHVKRKFSMELFRPIAGSMTPHAQPRQILPYYLF